MIRILTALFLLSVGSFAQAPATLIADPGSRATISLDGNWSSIVDPYESGIPSRYFEKEKPKSKSDLVEFDYDHSPKLKVPGDWNTQRESLLFMKGQSGTSGDFRINGNCTLAHTCTLAQQIIRLGCG